MTIIQTLKEHLKAHDCAYTQTEYRAFEFVIQCLTYGVKSAEAEKVTLMVSAAEEWKYIANKSDDLLNADKFNIAKAVKIIKNMDYAQRQPTSGQTTKDSVETPETGKKGDV